MSIEKGRGRIKIGKREIYNPLKSYICTYLTKAKQIRITPLISKQIHLNTCIVISNLDHDIRRINLFDVEIREHAWPRIHMSLNFMFDRADGNKCPLSCITRVTNRRHPCIMKKLTNIV